MAVAWYHVACLTLLTFLLPWTFNGYGSLIQDALQGVEKLD